MDKTSWKPKIYKTDETVDYKATEAIDYKAEESICPQCNSSDTRKMELDFCLLYTSPSPRDGLLSRMPSSA